MENCQIVTQLKARETIDKNVAEIATYQKENEKNVDSKKIKQKSPMDYWKCRMMLNFMTCFKVSRHLM